MGDFGRTRLDETPDIEELDDLLARMICAYEFGEATLRAVQAMIEVCLAYTDPADKSPAEGDLWCHDSGIIDELQRLLEVRGVKHVLRLDASNVAGLTVYKNNLDMAASGIKTRIKNAR
jgi:hypothetical protein